jgi:hypothetical protein
VTVTGAGCAGMSVEIVNASNHKYMTDPLREAVQAFLRYRSQMSAGGIGHVSAPVHIPADQIAQAAAWDADVVVIEGHGHWSRPGTVELASKVTSDPTATAWPDVLPAGRLGIRVLILGACNSGERPVKDAIRRRLHPDQRLPVLSSRGTSRTWQGYLIYFTVLVRLDGLTCEEWQNPLNIERALDQALLDAQHLWGQERRSRLQRHHHLDLGGYPLECEIAQDLKRQALRARKEERAREPATDDWNGWSVHVLQHDPLALQW